MVEVVDRVCGIVRRVLDRAADQPGLGCLPDGERGILRRGAETVLQIARERDGHRCGHGSRLAQGLPARDLAIAASERRGCGAARGGQRRVAQAFEDAGRRHVPGVGDEEGARPTMEGGETIGEGCHGGVHRTSIRRAGWLATTITETQSKPVFWEMLGRRLRGLRGFRGRSVVKCRFLTARHVSHITIREIRGNISDRLPVDHLTLRGEVLGLIAARLVAERDGETIPHIDD